MYRLFKSDDVNKLAVGTVVVVLLACLLVDLLVDVAQKMSVFCEITTMTLKC